MRLRNVLTLALLVALFSISGLADSISPSSFNAVLAIGGTASLNKTVSVTQQATGAVDVFFLTDTTGSMGGTISSVRSGFGNILSAVSAVSVNTNYGAGQYKDNGDVFVYNQDQDLTGNTALVQGAINGWSAGGGGDYPEANLYALQQVADTTTWRSGSQRFIVWSGDAPGHDPSGPTGVTEAQATAALLAQGIKVLAVDVGALDNYGQATRITAATGGSYTSGSYGSTETIIINALSAGVLNYSTVGLAIQGLTPGLTVTLTPNYSGTYDRSINRDFGFTVGFEGVAAGTYDFDIAALVDGAVVDTEHDHIVVGSDASIPEPGSILLLGTGVLLFGFARLRRKA